MRVSASLACACALVSCQSVPSFSDGFSLTDSCAKFESRYSFNKYNSLNKNDSRNLAIKVFSLGWILQFIGHGLFEKKAPALLNHDFFINQYFNVSVYSVK